MGWLLLETGSEGVRSWIWWGLKTTSLAELVALAHHRWFIERFHEDSKMALGLGHFEGRRWKGLNHHLTPVLIAHTFLVREQARVTIERATDRDALEEAEDSLPTWRRCEGALSSRWHRPWCLGRSTRVGERSGKAGGRRSPDTGRGPYRNTSREAPAAWDTGVEPVRSSEPLATSEDVR